MNAALARWMYGTIALLVLAGAAPKAKAEEPAQEHSEEAVSGSKDVETSRWYGLPILVIDVVALGVFAGGVLAVDHHSDAGGPLVMTGLGGYVLGGPIVHFAKGRTGEGFGSLGLRVLAPLVGATLGALVGGAFDSCNSDSCAPAGMAAGALLGFLGGLLVGSVVDNAVLAFKPATAQQLTLSVLPIYKSTTGQTGVALRGTW